MTMDKIPAAKDALAYGRRTKVNVRKGKVIRKAPDGFENFMDYFPSESSLNLSFEEEKTDENCIDLRKTKSPSKFQSNIPTRIQKNSKIQKNILHKEVTKQAGKISSNNDTPAIQAGSSIVVDINQSRHSNLQSDSIKSGNLLQQHDVSNDTFQNHQKYSLRSSIQKSPEKDQNIHELNPPIQVESLVAVDTNKRQCSNFFDNAEADNSLQHQNANSDGFQNNSKMYSLRSSIPKRPEKDRNIHKLNPHIQGESSVVVDANQRQCSNLSDNTEAENSLQHQNTNDDGFQNNSKRYSLRSSILKSPGKDQNTYERQIIPSKQTAFKKVDDIHNSSTAKGASHSSSNDKEEAIKKKPVFDTEGIFLRNKSVSNKSPHKSRLSSETSCTNAGLVAKSTDNDEETDSVGNSESPLRNRSLLGKRDHQKIPLQITDSHDGLLSDESFVSISKGCISSENDDDSGNDFTEEVSHSQKSVKSSGSKLGNAKKRKPNNELNPDNRMSQHPAKQATKSSNKEIKNFAKTKRKRANQSVAENTASNKNMVPPSGSSSKKIKHSKEKSKPKLSSSPHSAVNTTAGASPDIRRSKRTRFQPLDYWKNERLLHRFTTSGGITFIGIEKAKETKENNLKIMKPGIREMKKGKQLEHIGSPDCSLIEDLTVLDPQGQKYVKAALVRPFDSFHWDGPSVDKEKRNGYAISRSFQSEFFGTGYIKIGALQQKNLQYLPNHDVVFAVVKGKLEVRICDSVLSLKQYDTFLVPQGNAYSINNLSKTEALLTYSSVKYSLLNDL